MKIIITHFDSLTLRVEVQDMIEKLRKYGLIIKIGDFTLASKDVPWMNICSLSLPGNHKEKDSMILAYKFPNPEKKNIWIQKLQDCIRRLEEYDIIIIEQDTTPELHVKFCRLSDTAINIQTLQMPDALRGKGVLYSKDNITVASNVSPAVSKGFLGLVGSNRDNNSICRIRFDSKNETDGWLKEAKTALYHLAPRFNIVVKIIEESAPEEVLTLNLTRRNNEVKMTVMEMPDSWKPGLIYATIAGFEIAVHRNCMIKERGINLPTQDARWDTAHLFSDVNEAKAWMQEAYIALNQIKGIKLQLDREENDTEILEITFGQCGSYGLTMHVDKMPESLRGKTCIIKREFMLVGSSDAPFMKMGGFYLCGHNQQHDARVSVIDFLTANTRQSYINLVKSCLYEIPDVEVVIHE